MSPTDSMLNAIVGSYTTFSSLHRTSAFIQYWIPRHLQHRFDGPTPDCLHLGTVANLNLEWIRDFEIGEDMAIKADVSSSSGVNDPSGTRLMTDFITSNTCPEADHSIGRVGTPTRASLGDHAGRFVGTPGSFRSDVGVLCSAPRLCVFRLTAVTTFMSLRTWCIRCTRPDSTVSYTPPRSIMRCSSCCCKQTAVHELQRETFVISGRVDCHNLGLVIWRKIAKHGHGDFLAVDHDAHGLAIGGQLPHARDECHDLLVPGHLRRVESTAGGEFVQQRLALNQVHDGRPH